MTRNDIVSIQDVKRTLHKKGKTSKGGCDFEEQN